MGRFCVQISPVYRVFIQTPEGVFLARLVTPFSLPPFSLFVGQLQTETLWNDERLQLILPIGTKFQ